MADQNDKSLSQMDMLKLILPMLARIDGKVDVMMMELAKLKAKESGSPATEELEKLYKTADHLGASAIEKAADKL